MPRLKPAVLGMMALASAGLLFFQNCDRFSAARSPAAANSGGTKAAPGTTDEAQFAFQSALSSGTPPPYRSMSVQATRVLYPSAGGTVPLKALYSADFLDSILFLGGWKNESDFLEPIEGIPGAHGADKLYMSRLQSGAYVEPQPIRWTNPGFQPGKVNGYHANDISIVKPPSTDGINRSGWTYMYFTCLPSQYWADGVYNNLTCLSTSVDGGQTWTFRGPVIHQANGYDNGGAWSPSALVVGNEIWVYHHRNAPTDATFRTRLKADGWQLIATEVLKVNGANLLAANVDVIFDSRTRNYYLAANSLGAANFHDLVLYASKDGLNWQPYSATGPILVGAGALQLLTPHIASLGSDLLRLTFTINLGDQMQTHQWDVRLNR